MAKRIFWAALAAALVPLIFWLGGYDFNERGPEAVMVFIYSLMVGVAVIVMLPLLMDDE